MSLVLFNPWIGPLSGATTPGQSGPGIDGTKGILRIPQSSSIAWASPSDCLVSYPPRCSEAVGVPTAPADWTIDRACLIHRLRLCWGIREERPSSTRGSVDRGCLIHRLHLCRRIREVRPSPASVSVGWGYLIHRLHLCWGITKVRPSPTSGSVDRGCLIHRLHLCWGIREVRPSSTSGSAGRGCLIHRLHLWWGIRKVRPAPTSGSVGWGCLIHRLHLCWGIRLQPPTRLSPLGRGCIIHRLRICRGGGYSQRVSSNDIKPSNVEAPVMQELYRKRSSPSLSSLAGVLWSRVVAPDRVLSMGQLFDI